MLIRETFVSVDEEKDRRCIFSEGEPYEPFTDNIKRLFLDLSRDYGRCVSKVYVDKKDGRTVACGWVFQKRMEYEDARRYGRKATSNDFYVREVWVHLYKKFEKVVTFDVEDYCLGRATC